MNGGQLPTNQLHVHDINWGVLDHSSRAPQLMSCNYYTLCVHTHTHTHTYVYTHSCMLLYIDQLCSKANEVVTTSRSIRGEIKPLVVSVQASKTEAHGKIHTAISESVEQAKLQKVQ